MDMKSIQILNKELTLPCGVKLSNRIAKSAMSENLSTKDNKVNDTLINVYREWAKGQTGLLITGNIMVDARALGEPYNVIVEDTSQLDMLRKWALVTKGTSAQLWAQINHPGRQAMEQINEELKAPSAVSVHITGRKNATKKIPIAMTENDINDCIDRYGNTASILKNAGFDGVQIHGAHGYLVSQFLSPLTNQRKDKWGGTLENRARFVMEVYKNIRRKVGASYPIGIKLNSADFQKGGFSEADAMQVVHYLSDAGIDLIEISGGTYEAPVMMGYKKKSTRDREAYFLDFVKKARKITSTPLMLTGGFRTPSIMASAVSDGHVDVIGLARPFTVYPHLTREILDGSREGLRVQNRKTGIKAIDGAMNLIWYEAQIKRLGEGKKPKLKLNPWLVFIRYVWGVIKKRT